jgi:glycosyltransferase involved in cell wall biosynthesis
MAAPSGPGTHIREVISALEKEGHDVIKLIAGGEKLERAERITFKKHSWKKAVPSIVWETLRDASMIRSDLRMEKQLLKAIDQHKPDVVYERSCYGMLAGLRACRKTGLRYIVEMNAPYPEEKIKMQGSSLLNFLGNRNEKMQVRGAHRVIVVSSAMKNYLISKTEAEKSKIIVIPNAVNLENLPTETKNITELRDKLQLEEANSVIGFVGSIFPYHGVDRMIDAFALIARDFPRVRMLIVGDGEVLPQLKRQANDLLLNDKITFTGNVPHSEVYHYIALMNITVMARSNWYGSPVKIFEYGAMQKVIVAPNVIPVRDVMTHGIDGLLIEDSTEALEKAIRLILNNPQDASKMAQTFHEKIIAQFTWRSVAKQILNACE